MLEEFLQLSYICEIFDSTFRYLRRHSFMYNKTLQNILDDMSNQIATRVIKYFEEKDNFIKVQNKELIEQSRNKPRIEMGEIFITPTELVQKLKISRTTLWRLQRSGKFPKPRKVLPNKVLWLSTEIEEWMKA
jgi:predicted DNA-binding transcriptional regulator AlpA